MISDQELWSAIRYLDPESDRGACNFAAIIALVVAAFIFCIVYVFLLLRGL